MIALSFVRFFRLFSFAWAIVGHFVITASVLAEGPTLFFRDRPFHSARSEDGSLKDPRLPPSVEPRKLGQDYDLAFVEFDEHGDFWDRDQLRDASRAIKATAHEADARNGNILLLEYVHGWHNNAQDHDPNRDVESFRLLLKTLARSPYIKEQRYCIFGAYIGWRGEMFREDSHNPLTKPLWLPHTLSFYPEKHIGSTVGSMPMATEAIFWLVHEVRHNSAGAHTVLIGHSFGAMVLENAIAQGIASSVAGTTSSTIFAPADLVLLINSANDSMRAKGLEEMFSRMGPSAPSVNKDRPLIVSVTSDGDWPNMRFFPIGTGLANLFRGFRSYTMFNKQKLSPPENQRSFVTRTPEHNPYLRSHNMTVDEPNEISPSKPLDKLSPAEYDNLQKIFDENLAHPKPMQGVGPSRTWHFSSIAKSGRTCQSTITPIPGAKNATPYWILNVPKSVIKDHGDIFNQQTLCLYAALFRIDSPTKAPAGPRVLQLTP